MSIKESATSYAVKKAVKYARKDFNKNAPKILSLLEMTDVKKVNRTTYAGMHKVMDDPENNWMRFVKSVICDTNEKVVEKMIPPMLNVAINSYVWRILKSTAATFRGRFLWTRPLPAILSAQAAGLQNTATQASFHTTTLQEL